MKYHDALIAESKYRATTLEVFRDVQSRYYQLYLTDQLIALAQESVGVLKQTLGSAPGEARRRSVLHLGRLHGPDGASPDGKHAL